MQHSFRLVIVSLLIWTGAASCTSGRREVVLPPAQPERTEAPATAAATTTPDAATILLGDAITIQGAGAAVHEEGVLITGPGAYRISGVLAAGMVQVNAPGATVELILDGATITNPDGPAILFAQAGEAIVTLPEGAVNALVDGGASDFDAALYSNASLTIRGEGDLHVTGNNLEGISSVLHIHIAGGNIWVRGLEDGLNANNDNVSVITISGGYLYIESQNGDGIDSNGAITITGGTVITMSSLADASGGLDADGDVTISGGTVIATGARLSTPVAGSPQRSILVSYSAAQAANTLVSIQEAGRPILTFVPAVAYQSLLYSAPDIKDNVSYEVYTGGSATGDVVDGLYTNAQYTPGSLVGAVTTASTNR